MTDKNEKIFRIKWDEESYGKVNDFIGNMEAIKRSFTADNIDGNIYEFYKNIDNLKVNESFIHYTMTESLTIIRMK